jgi:hypothetical protein
MDRERIFKAIGQFFTHLTPGGAIAIVVALFVIFCTVAIIHTQRAEARDPVNHFLRRIKDGVDPSIELHREPCGFEAEGLVVPRPQASCVLYADRVVVETPGRERREYRAADIAGSGYNQIPFISHVSLKLVSPRSETIRFRVDDPHRFWRMVYCVFYKDTPNEQD